MPWLYRYIEVESKEILYIGLVYSNKKEALINRLETHRYDFLKKDSPWYEYNTCNFKIEVLTPDQVKSRNDAEMLEGHFISEYKSFLKLNKAKSKWGKSSFISSRNFNWILLTDIQYCGNIKEYTMSKQYNNSLEEKLTNKIKELELVIDTQVKKYNELLDIYHIEVDKLKQRIKELEYHKSTTKNQRISDGIKRAQRNGTKIGHNIGTKLITKKQIKCIELITNYSKDFNGTLGDSELIKLCGCSKNSYYKYKRLIRQTV